jgi:hypothetical protein
MPNKAESLFDPKLFLAKVGEGKTILNLEKNQAVFAQGDIADAVFYKREGLRFSLSPNRAKKPWSESRNPDSSLVKDASMAIRCGFRQRWRWKNA